MTAGEEPGWRPSLGGRLLPGGALARGWQSVGRWLRAARHRDGSPAQPAELVAHRNERTEAAIIFVHGFGSDGNPFGRFHEVLAGEPALAGWDLYSLGYSTSLMPDLASFWESDPSIPLLASYLSTRVELDPLDDYEGIALVAHSMGGLVAQQALLDDPKLADRVSHLFLFGTPSGGVRIARWAAFLKQQIEDMAEGGPFIAGLRRRWQQRFGAEPPFELWAVAGDRDRFVPSSSSLGPFPAEVRRVVPGDHLEVVDVAQPESMSARVVIEGLLGEGAPGGAWDSALLAAESSEHDRVIRELGDDPAALDEQHLVELALAYEATGRRDDAIALLVEHACEHGSAAKGALADQYKRNWLDEGRKRDAEAALELYTEALAEALEAGDEETAYGQAIDLAFMQRAYRRDHRAAAEAARQALEACRRAPESYWRRASEAEAGLHLDNPERALEGYREALALAPTAGEMQASFLQARQLLECLGRRDLLPALEAAFAVEREAPGGRRSRAPA